MFSRTPRRRFLGVLASVLGVATQGCTDAEGVFTAGRLENRCDTVVPVCSFQANCVLGTDQYLRNTFPGGRRVIVRTQTAQTRIVTRTLILDPQFPGTEYRVRAYDVGCVDYTEGLGKDRDLFDLAGDDGVLEYPLDVTGRGDHLVEVYSDMGSNFLFAVDLE